MTILTAVTGNDRIDRLGTQLRRAMTYPVSSRRRLAGAAVASTLTYVVLILSTFPGMSVQMLAAGPEWFDDTLVLLTQNTLATVGATGLTLVVLYALLTGAAVTVAAGQLVHGDGSGSSTLGGVLPGFVVSGCASCGAGVLGLLGFAGALAAMPFHGNLLRVAGILLLLGFLAHAGDPRHCRMRGAD